MDTMHGQLKGVATEGDPALSDQAQLAIPVVAEELETGTRRVATGGVRVHKTVHEHEEIIDQPVRREHVEVRRIQKDELVDGPLDVRQMGETTIIPVVKEVLKIERQWVLTEEIHITKRRSEERDQQRVTLQHEEADVQRIDADGRDAGPVAPAVDRTDALPRTNTFVRKNKVIK